MLPKIKKYIRRLSLYEAKFAKTKEEKNKIKRLILKSLTSKTRFIKTKTIKELMIIMGVKPTVLTKTRISVFKSGKSMNDKIETIKRKGRAKIAVSKNNDARINKTKINLKFIRRIKV